MNAPNVCTASTTHRRIVSRNPKALGATTSSRNSVQWPSAKTPQSFRLSFVLFAFFVVNPFFKSAFRTSIRFSERLVGGTNSRRAREANPHSAIALHVHESPVYRALSGIIGFEISFRLSRAKPFSSPWARGYSAGAARTEGELVPCSTEPNIPIKNQKSKIKNVHERPVYRPLLEIIGFAFLKNSRLSLSTQPFCTKCTISHKITQRNLHDNPLYTIHLSLKTYLPPTPLCTNTNHSSLATVPCSHRTFPLLPGSNSSR
jgi:hypothetical protein